MKLEKFDRNKKKKRIVIASILGILLIVGGITLYRTFALYEEKLEFNVLKGRIPDFTSGDITLAMTLDGEAIDIYPEGREYRVKTTCEGAEGTWDYSTWSINIGNIINTKVKCGIDFESIYTITIDGAESKEFAAKEDTAYISMSCTNGTGNWNETNWKPNVTGLNENTTCEVKFQTKNNIFTYYVDNEKVESKPSQEYYYSGITSCTVGTASFDESKWEPVITQYEEGMKCDVNFGTTPITFSNYLITLSNTDSSIVKQTHETTSQTGNNATTDYRYIGSDPNNYVCLEGSGSCTTTNTKLYRIIGIIPTQSSASGAYENRVKLIASRNVSITGAYWSGSSSIKSNDWTKSTLNTELLNQTYWKNISSYQKYIDDAKWYLGGSGSDVTVSTIYKNERGSIGGKDAQDTIYTIAKIGLLYPSDWGYATAGGDTTNRNTCLTTNMQTWAELSVYDCQFYNWVTPKVKKWFITPSTVYAGASLMAFSSSGVPYLSSFSSDSYQQLTPVFYLKSNVRYKSGDGTFSNPYRIEIG